MIRVILAQTQDKKFVEQHDHLRTCRLKVIQKN